MVLCEIESSRETDPCGFSSTLWDDLGPGLRYNEMYVCRFQRENALWLWMRKMSGQVRRQRSIF